MPDREALLKQPDPGVKPSRLSPGAFYFFPVLAIPMLVILIYGNSFMGGFHFDDQKLIEINTAIRDLRHPLLVILSNDPGHKNRPLLMLSFGFNYHFSGNNVFGYHLFNILLHSFSSILVYFICLLLWHFSNGTKSVRRVAFHGLPPVGFILLAILFFCAQPMNTEAITYISGRSSSLATFFLLFGFWFFFTSRLPDVQVQPFLKGLRIGIAALFYCFACASKEIGIVLPVLLLAADFYFSFLPRHKGWGRANAIVSYCKERGASFLPFIFVIILFLAFRFLIQEGALLEKNSAFLQGNSRISYFCTQWNVILYYYINKLFFPQNQNIDISFETVGFPFNFSTLMAGAILIALVALAVLKRSSPWFSFGVFWFFVALSPTSSFVPILDVAVERRLYFSGIAMSFFWLHFLSGFSRRRAMIIIMPLLLLCANTIQRNTVYKDGITLWSDSSSKAVIEPRPHFNYAKALKRSGKHNEAIIEFQKAMATGYSPYNHEIHNGLGAIYMEKGLYNRAIDEFKEAINAKSNYDLPYSNLASAYLKTGETGKAEEVLLKALSINPGNVAARNNLGVIYAQKGLYEKAYKEFKAILEQNPSETDIKINLEKIEALLSSGANGK